MSYFFSELPYILSNLLWKCILQKYNMIIDKFFLSQKILTVSSLYGSWYFRRNEGCLIRVYQRLCEQTTVNRRLCKDCSKFCTYCDPEARVLHSMLYWSCPDVQLSGLLILSWWGKCVGFSVNLLSYVQISG